MPVTVEALITKTGNATGEGPHWDERTQTFLYVDIHAYEVHRWSADTRIDEKYTFDDNCSLVVPCKKGGYLVGIGKSVCHFDWDSKKLTVLQTVDEDKGTRINDGKCDASGRLWFGTMSLGKTVDEIKYNEGSLYSLEVDGTVRKHKEGVSISNGLAWTADNKTMYYIDSIPRKVFGYDFGIKTGTMSNERVVVDFDKVEGMPKEALPDGMTIDADDKLWVACFLGGRITRFDPNTGEEMTRINIAAKRTTSCCFGGKNFDELFITSITDGATEEELKETPLAGSVFRVTGLEIKGRPAPIYEG
ncbi:regucalcin-like [Ruditapes philippinarum]|uniref:regucalcin-like n=1 Tax=Ruditapes philippinarum TaxID=129788 RepID=UPI00295B0BB7|nr:regucalcin-like [Ruditapes philippinarum]XP_060566400.1 regucalcin-like [Ruditapes philippinarum]XP_060566401.1 regucalcin-like [Ruditapes philippinarum]XP_060566402.1 regucalcin-like [Ruditapes philippinarum]